MVRNAEKLVLIVILFTLFLSSLYLRYSQVEVVNSTNDYPVHNLNTGLNYTSIQDAINCDETLDGHTILVDARIYFEHVVITKSIFLLGESWETTVIDGSGTGTVLRISADGVTVINFTIRNGGYDPSWLDSCIYGNHHRDVLIENNRVMNATNGVIFYGFSNSMIRNNFVEGCELMGLHLDGESSLCTIANNTIANCLEGIELEKSAENFVYGNKLLNNNASVVLNQCGGHNVFRDNTMTSDWYNIVIWGGTIDAFMQDIDTSNTVNNKTVYYITNSNSSVKPQSHPNLGYLAVINCTYLTIEDIDLSYNRDGLLLAKSTNCSLVNVTICGNRGPLLSGGVTLFRSNDNVMVNSRISNNSVGICLYQSTRNAFYHNTFVGNDRQVVSNFCSPFSPPSGSYSRNRWDNGFEGNYWSDYTGEDVNGDGIGDTPYVIDKNNRDSYPLMNPWSPKTTVEVPFWIQWWFWAIVAAGVVVLAEAVYFLKKRKPSTKKN